MSEWDGIPNELWNRGVRYYEGTKGVGCWTVREDKEGWYYSFFLKPTGTGARQGQADKFTYVPRLTTKRRKRSACKARSENLAYGKSVTRGITAKPKPNNPPGTGYCMSEKKHVLMTDMEEVTAKNGRTMLAGKCPDCGCKIQKYGRLIDCPECGQHREASANDYICKACRLESND